MVEMYEDLYGRRAELMAAIEQGTPTAEAVQALNAINAALGEQVYVADPLADRWDADLAAGRVPDLDAVE